MDPRNSFIARKMYKDKKDTCKIRGTLHLLRNTHRWTNRHHLCVCVCVAHTFSCISNTCYAHFLIHINYILVYQRGLRDGNAMPHGASELVPNGRVGETKFIRALSTSCPCIDARYETSGTMICAHNATRYIQIISYVNNKILCVDIHLQT